MPSMRARQLQHKIILFQSTSQHCERLVVEIMMSTGRIIEGVGFAVDDCKSTLQLFLALIYRLRRLRLDGEA